MPSDIRIDNSSISYFCSSNNMECHTIRIIMYEKDVNVKIHQEVNKTSLPKQITDNNPFLYFPTLVDRELMLYFNNVIIDYLDERFPHPPTLPVTPHNRAKMRLSLERLKKDWFEPAKELMELNKRSEKRRKEIIKELRESLLSSIDLFNDGNYLFNNEFTLLDCYAMPFLWRLKWMGINLNSAKAKPMTLYMQRMFKRPSFLLSCTQFERSMIV